MLSAEKLLNQAPAPHAGSGVQSCNMGISKGPRRWDEKSLARPGIFVGNFVGIQQCSFHSTKNINGRTPYCVFSTYRKWGATPRNSAVCLGPPDARSQCARG